MRILSRRILREFWEKHRDVEEPLKAWHQEVSKASWKTIHDLKALYPSASILRDNKIVFNIRGNHYRLIVKFKFEHQICWIRFIGTHAEYDKIDANQL